MTQYVKRFPRKHTVKKRTSIALGPLIGLLGLGVVVTACGAFLGVALALLVIAFVVGTYLMQDPSIRKAVDDVANLVSGGR